MNSSSRTPLLLGVMVLAVGVFLADQFQVFSFMDNWGQAEKAKIAKLDSDIVTLEDLIVSGAAAGEKLAIYDQRSMPYKTDLARSEYQAWLNQIVTKNQLLASSVEVSVPSSVTIKDGNKKREAYKRYGFSVGAAGSLDQVSNFLFDFYRAGHLHKINSMSLNPASGQFRFSVTGEAIGLNSCERAGSLSEAVGDRLAKKSLDEYTTIVRRNVFSREVGATLKLVRLSSITYDKSGVPEAWFKVGAQQATKKLQRSDSLSASVHDVQVIDIQPRSVLVDVDGEILNLPVGQTLYEAMSGPEIAGK